MHGAQGDKVCNPMENDMKDNVGFNSERRVDTQGLTMAGWLDRLDSARWARRGRMGVGEARRAAIEMMWRHGMNKPQEAIAFAQSVCADPRSAPMEARLAGVGVLAAWTVQGKALPWIGTERAVGCNEGMAWQEPSMDCGVFDVIMSAQPQPCVKGVAMAAFRALVAGRERQQEEASARAMGMPEKEEPEGMRCEAAWARFDPERMLARIEGRADRRATAANDICMEKRPVDVAALRLPVWRRSVAKAERSALAMRIVGFMKQRR